MISRFLNIVCHHIFKRQHTLNIHIACTGNQIPLIGIFTGELKTDQMAPVIQESSIHKVILRRLPTGRFYLSNGSTGFRRHQILANTGYGIGTAVECIQILIVFITAGRIVFFCKQGDITVEHRKGFTAVRWNLSQQIRGNLSLFLYRQNKIQNQQQDHHNDRSQGYFFFLHRT